MTGRLTLVCHGATDATRAAAFPLDEPLAAGATTAAQVLAPGLRRADHAWTSPALRARQTAEALSLAAHGDPALSDCDHGRWAGRALAEVQAAEPDAVAAWLADPAAAPHGGEAIVDLVARMGGWLDARLGDAGHTVAVTHAAVMRAAILHVLGAPADSFRRIDIEPLGMIGFGSDGRRWALRAWGPAAPKPR
jgi:broad specificity phosphatase PhoE